MRRRAHHHGVSIRAEDFPALCADLERALGELTSGVQRDESLWTRGRPRKWTAGQHAAHVGLIIAMMTDAFEAAESGLRSGTSSAPPRRGLLQSLFVTLVVEKGYMPRGAKAVARSLPPERPEKGETLATLRRDAGRLRALGERLTAPERDRLWIWNPLGGIPSRITTWHYRLPEAARLHAVHARHHARLIAEIPA